MKTSCAEVTGGETQRAVSKNWWFEEWNEGVVEERGVDRKAAAIH